MLVRRHGIGTEPRRGALIVLLAFLGIGLLSFVALSIDLGLLMIARNNCQNAADSGALAGVRTINGDVAAGYRKVDVPKNSVTAMNANSILSGPVVASVGSIASTTTDAWESQKVTVELGSYTYEYTNNVDTEGFMLRFPRTQTTQPYGAVRTRVNYDTGRFGFARVFGMTSFSTGATATAVHRPRDMVIVMDLSGSMRFQSQIGTPIISGFARPSNNQNARTRSMNPDPDFPTFGHYSDQMSAALYGNTAISTGEGEFVDPANITTTSDSGPPIAEFFFSDVNAGTRAFTRAPTSYAAMPAGDVPLKRVRDTNADYAQTLSQVYNTLPANETDAQWEANGYSAGNLGRGTFNGYTTGPHYLGKTFFIWPPDSGDATSACDPANYANNGAEDWRQRFFIKVPLDPTFSGQIFRNTAPNEYPTGYSGWIRVTGMGGNRPTVGDSAAIGNELSRAYQVTGVRELGTYDANVCEIQLNRTVNNRVRDSDSAAQRTIQFRDVGWVCDNPVLWDAAGNWRNPGPFLWNANWSAGSNDNTALVGGQRYFYRTNYAAILRWLRTTGANPFPTSLRAGRLWYYRALPDDTDVNLNWRCWTNTMDTNTDAGRNEQFWRDYIDFVLCCDHRQGNQTTGGSLPSCERYTAFNYEDTGRPRLSALIGTGDFYNWGAFRISDKPTVTNTPAYLSGNLFLQALSGTSVITTSGLSKAPRAGDIVVFNGNTAQQFVVAATPAPSTVAFTVTTPLTNTIPIGTPVAFRQLGKMHYDDNPRRPRYQFWFGAATLIDFLGNYNTGQLRWPGTVPEAQSWACKIGIQVAIEDIKLNHPNDCVSTIFYSSPGSGGKHNQAKVALRSMSDAGHYQRLINSLWYPAKVYSGGQTEIHWLDGDEVPRADGGTTPIAGFMLAYNQLSASRQVADLREYATGANVATSPENGIVGGRGRKGAEKVVIYETDGAPNSRAGADFVNQTSTAPDGSLSNDSYFRMRIFDRGNPGHSSNEYPWTAGSSIGNTTMLNEFYTVAQTLCNFDAQDAPSPLPAGYRYGHSTKRRKVKIHSIGYGSLFSPSNAGSQQTSGLEALQRVQVIGSTATDNSATAFPEYKRIYGDINVRVDKMKNAFETIMQDGVSVTLIR